MTCVYDTCAYSVAVRGSGANSVIWRPTKSALGLPPALPDGTRPWGRRFETIIRRDEVNPVAPDSALNVYVAHNYMFSDPREAEGYIFLGRIAKEVAMHIGPLVSSGVVRVGVLQPFWDTFTAAPNSQWYLDLVLLIDRVLTRRDHERIQHSIDAVTAAAARPASGCPCAEITRLPAFSVEKDLP